MADVHTVSREIGGRTLTMETGRIARQADGAVLVTYGETVVLVAAVVAPPEVGRDRFLPPERRLPRKQQCRRQVPRRLHQTGGKALDQRNPDGAEYRPADSSAVSGRVLQRSADHGLGAQRRSGERSRCPGDDRRQCGAVHQQDSRSWARWGPAGSAGSTASSSSIPPTSNSKPAI